MGRERAGEPCLLARSEAFPSSAENMTDPVERVALAASVAEGLLLDPAAHVIDCSPGELDDVPTCTGLVTHGLLGLDGIQDVAGVVGEGGGGGVEVSADVDLDLEQWLQGPDNLPDTEPGGSLEVASDR